MHLTVGDTEKESFFKEAHNCWHRSELREGALVYSGRDYYRAFREAVLQAESSVYILAWDISASIKTVREEDYGDGHPSGLADFIFSVLEAKPDLEIYILLWDYSMMYISEREWLPFSRWRQEAHPRLHFEVDDAISMGASHHQKVVVVDEQLAFCGGFDLSAWRWDTEAHKPKDSRRETPKGEPYQPYHDAQLVLTGEVVDALSDLCAMRWERATGQVLPRSKVEQNQSLWPSSIDVDFKSESVALALTFSKYKDYDSVRQIEQLHLDIIAKAKRYIYIENQYLSSHVIVKALSSRLREEDGPEVVIVLTKDTGGLLEEGTMGVLRDRLLEILSEADLHGRFSALYPYVADEDGNTSQVYVHAKLLIADDSILEIGSANLSNRSMHVDSEVDLAIVKDAPSAPIRGLLHKLLSIHFQCELVTVSDVIDANTSLDAAIKSLREGRLHKLMPLEIGSNSMLMRKLADSQLLDPNEPISPAYWMRETFVRDDTDSDKSSSKWKQFAKIASWVLVGLFLAYGVKQLWGGMLEKGAVIAWFEGFADSSWVLPLLFGVFALAGLIGVPINLLLVAGTVALGPWETFVCGFLGSLASAALAFWMGHQFGKPLLEKVAKNKLQSLSNKVGTRGVFSVAVIRVLPIAPFVVINLVAGFSSLRFRTYFIGSVMGMLPGMLGVVLLTNRAQSLFSDPNWKTWSSFIAVAVGFGVASYFIRKKLKA
jgi:phosphatidylserine/phosphatidylglycerophosphate/cardiolipin synthase-like enzyme/uncharacterized membrane protein YdjX (TVP38/TMEM64 family)